MWLVPRVRPEQGWLGTMQTSRCSAGRRLVRSQRIFPRRTNAFFGFFCSPFLGAFGAPTNVVLICVNLLQDLQESLWLKGAELYSRRLTPLFQLIYTTCVQEDSEFQFNRCPFAWPGDMRAEIQQAVGLLKSEAENATASKNPLATKLLGVADSLQNVEKDLAISFLSGKFWVDGKVQSMCRSFNSFFMGEDDDREWDLGCPNVWNSPNSFQFELGIFGVPVHSRLNWLRRTPWARCVSCWRIPIGSWGNAWISRCRCRVLSILLAIRIRFGMIYWWF